MKQFYIRCSAIGRIMTEPRNKNEELSETAKSYCKEWLTEQIYNKKKEIQSKYLTKGIECEQLGIDRYNNTFNTFCTKNEEEFANDYLTGTPDIITEDSIIDIKNSWDCFTFPLFEKDIPNKDYYWQLQGYMALTGKEKAQLVYVLEDYIDEYSNVYDYLGVDNKYRIKVFDTEIDYEAIELINSKVRKCRAYITNLINELE